METITGGAGMENLTIQEKIFAYTVFGIGVVDFLSFEEKIAFVSLMIYLSASTVLLLSALIQQSYIKTEDSF